MPDLLWSAQLGVALVQALEDTLARTRRRLVRGSIWTGRRATGVAKVGVENAEGAERPLRFTVFGPIGAWRGEEQLDLGPARQRAVLAVLLLHANRSVGRERLIEAVWGDPAPAFAVNQLQKYISALRRVLEPGRAARSPSGVLAWSESGYALRVEPGGLDLTVFERQADLGRKALAQQDVRLAAAELAEALELWSGPALSNVSSAVLNVERDRLAELRTAVLEERIQADLQLGRHGKLIPELTQLVAEFPLRECFASLLMLALFRAGRQAEALAVYETTRSVLAEELGIDPGPELQQRHQQILTSDTSLALDAAGVDTQGWHRQDQVSAPRRPGTAEDLALRLDDARKMQIKAGDEARTAYALVFWLLEMVNSLQERVSRLEAETGRHAPGPELEQELAASHERLSTARKQLTQARREREKAEEIQLATQRLVEDRLHGRKAASQPRPEEAGAAHERFTSAEDFGLAPLYEVDHFLEASEERLVEQAAHLDKLSKELNLTESAERTEGDNGPQAVRGQLADITPTSGSALPARSGVAGNSPARDVSSPQADAEHEQAPAAEPLAAQPKRGIKRARRLLTGILVGAAALVLFPLPFYDSRTIGLDYDAGNFPVKAIKKSSTPVYSWQGSSDDPDPFTGPEDLWATFTPPPRTPTIPVERRLKARLILSTPEQADPDCSSDQVVGVAWSLVVDGEEEVASGTLLGKDGDSVAINSDLPSEPETILLTAADSSRCGYELRMENPAIRYSGLWGES